MDPAFPAVLTLLPAHGFGKADEYRAGTADTMFVLASPTVAYCRFGFWVGDTLVVAYPTPHNCRYSLI